MTFTKPQVNIAGRRRCNSLTNSWLKFIDEMLCFFACLCECVRIALSDGFTAGLQFLHRWLELFVVACVFGSVLQGLQTVFL